MKKEAGEQREEREQRMKKEAGEQREEREQRICFSSAHRSS